VNNLPELPDFPGAILGASDSKLEDYLDHLCAPLVGVVPFEKRVSLREEARLHITGLAEDYQEQGCTPDKALCRALREMGEPWQWGEAILREWRPPVPSQGILSLTWRAAYHAFAWFGPPAVVCLLLVEQCAVALRQDYMLPALILLGAASPVAAGVLTGLTSPARAGKGACIAACLLGLVSLIAGALMWPKTEPLTFGLLQLLFWPATGWLSATAAATSVRQYRRMHFLRLVR
jgi:hypothetical protein